MCQSESLGSIHNVTYVIIWPVTVQLFSKEHKKSSLKTSWDGTVAPLVIVSMFYEHRVRSWNIFMAERKRNTKNSHTPMCWWTFIILSQRMKKKRSSLMNTLLFIISPPDDHIESICSSFSLFVSNEEASEWISVSNVRF